MPASRHLSHPAESKSGAEVPAKLAFVYHPRSIPALSIVAAARGLCDLVWVIDSSQPDLGTNPRLLSRFGSLVDVANLSQDAAAQLLAGHGVSGILALADSDLAWTAQVAEKLALPFHSPAVAARLTDKFQQRTALRAGALPVPGFWVISGADDKNALSQIRAETQFPGVLKPRQGEASRDTVPVESIDAVIGILTDLGESSSATRDFVLEEYIKDAPEAAAGAGFANYVSVESIVSNSTVSHLAITGRLPPAFPFRETGFLIPSALPAELVSAVLDMASRAALALGITIGCLHTEIKLTPTGPVVIEVNGRIGGGIPEMLEVATGEQFLRIALRLALGEHVEFSELLQCEQVGYLLYVQAPAEYTLITAVEGLDELRQVTGVDEITLNRGAGQAVDWRNGNHGHVFSVVGAVDDCAAVQRIDRAVRTLVTIRGE